MDLGKHVLDKSLLDREGYRAGKVDDLLLDIPEGSQADLREPLVVAVVTGPTSLSRRAAAPMRVLACWLYRLAGIRDPRPVEIAWSHVTSIDVAVHLDLGRTELGLDRLRDAVSRLIERIPGA
ncbi:MAG: hypothetical protein ACYDAG_01875 [Chloroflexota bacterium]